MINKKYIAILATASIICVGAGLVIIKGNSSVSTVGTSKVTTHQLNQYRNDVRRKLPIQNPHLEESQIEDVMKSMEASLITDLENQKIFELKAIELGLVESKKDLNKKVSDEVDTIIGSFSDEYVFKEYLADNGMTLSSFTEATYKQVLESLMFEYIFKDITISEEEILKYYQENEKSMVKYPGAIVYQIKSDSEEEINRANEELKAGESFESVVEKYNQGYFKSTAGQLGYIEFKDEFNIFSNETTAKLKELNSGDIYGPIKEGSEFMILKVDNVDKTQKQLTYDESKDLIKSKLLADKQMSEYQKTLELWRTELVAPK